MTEESIWIVTEADSTEVSETITGAKGIGNPWSRTLERVSTSTQSVRISASQLEKKMSEFLKVVRRIFGNIEQNANLGSGYQLDEIELSVEITAEGTVKLIGNGGQAGAKGAITLKFKRTDSE